MPFDKSLDPASPEGARQAAGLVAVGWVNIMAMKHNDLRKHQSIQPATLEAMVDQITITLAIATGIARQGLKWSQEFHEGGRTALAEKMREAGQALDKLEDWLAEAWRSCSEAMQAIADDAGMPPRRLH
jgi:hypothetical protein